MFLSHHQTLLGSERKAINIIALSPLIYCMEISYKDKMTAIFSIKHSPKNLLRKISITSSLFSSSPPRKIRNFQFSLFIVYFLKSAQFIAIAFKPMFSLLLTPHLPSEFPLKCYRWLFINCIFKSFLPASARNKLRAHANVVLEHIFY